MSIIIGNNVIGGFNNSLVVLDFTPWILQTGLWNDDGKWIDTALWID